MPMNPRYDPRYATRREYDVLNNDEHNFAIHDGDADGDEYEKMTLAETVQIEKKEK